ncbi:alpha/beta hydrolase [Acinetobacter towneri]|uniref:alpha/beta hydrolase n=1 Tax=Acinetobacter towneri TaxID=202956 RepID=UPI001F17CCFC|nr:alpha/beta fold hydrolase [Acinetobacter towneri]UIP26026.1 alpha/beta fold hydrolase [Acinetobacter towneri]
MRKIWLSVALASSSLLLTACNDDHDDTSVVVIDDGIPKHSISNPLVVTPEAYILSDMAATADQSVKMTYKMLGVHGSEVQATALLFTPKTAPPLTGWPIVVWAHGTTGVADACAPSKAPLNMYIKGMIDQLLAAGYVVVAPDYEGLGEPSSNEAHPFLNLQSAAFSITDAVVAARNYLGNQAAKQWVTVGHSQGGHAALGAAQYASRAQLDYKGTIAIAPASNLAAILTVGEQRAAQLTNIEDKINTLAMLDTYTALITAGLRNKNPSLSYQQVFKSPTDGIAALADTECSDVLGATLGAAMGQYAAGNEWSIDGYPRTQPNFLSLPDVSQFLSKDSQPLQVKVNQPVIIYQGGADAVVPKDATDLLLNGTAAKQSNIQYRAEATWDHGTAYALNIPNIVKDVQSLMPIQ